MFSLFRKKEKKPRRERAMTEAADLPTADVIPACDGVRIGAAHDSGARRRDALGLAADGKNVLLAVLADGAEAPDSARTAVKAALQSFRSEGAEKDDGQTLLRILKRACDALAKAGPAGGGTSLLAVLLRGQRLCFLSAGDSRLSLLRGGGLIRLNRERYYDGQRDNPAALALLDPERARDRGRRTAAGFPGGGGELRIDRNTEAISLCPGDKIVLMSCGTARGLGETELTQLLTQEPEAAARAIYDAVIRKNGPQQDSVTVLVLEIE